MSVRDYIIITNTKLVTSWLRCSRFHATSLNTIFGKLRSWIPFFCTPPQFLVPVSSIYYLHGQLLVKLSHIYCCAHHLWKWRKGLLRLLSCIHFCLSNWNSRCSGGGLSGWRVLRLLAGVETLSIDHANSRHVAHHQTLWCDDHPRRRTCFRPNPNTTIASGPPPQTSAPEPFLE